MDRARKGEIFLFLYATFSLTTQNIQRHYVEKKINPLRKKHLFEL